MLEEKKPQTPQKVSSKQMMKKEGKIESISDDYGPFGLPGRIRLPLENCICQFWTPAILTPRKMHGPVPVPRIFITVCFLKRIVWLLI